MQLNSFAAEIIRVNKKRPDHPVLIDRNCTRTTKWSAFYEAICRVAAYAEKENISGIVPVWMDRGLEAFTSILGLSLAGAGVAPLSITTPESRCELISSQVENKAWTMENWEAAMKCEPDYSIADQGKAAEPAYVVFTSGSTGVPKGVQLGNWAVIAEMKRMAGPDFYDMKEGDRILQHASMSFIALVMDILSPLYAGCPVYVLPEEAKGDVRAMTGYINRYGISHTFMSPQLYRMFEGAPSLRCIILGSDKIVNIGPKGHRLIAAYGMSETAGPSFFYEIRKPMDVSPIGLPSPEFECYVLDENGNPADEGEICVSGAIAGGYLNLPEQTATAFTPNPWAKDPEHGILLHTGDMVRRDKEYGLLYLCRKDNMIKINGQRVEPGEIEKRMMEFDGVRTAVVRGFTDEHTRTILCGYYTAERDVDEEALKKSLSGSLPHYMVPAVLVKLDEMPLNANGKLDRKALKLPDMRQYQKVYEEPRGEAEILLARAFEKCLNLPKVGRNDDFFLIGGDSIKALEVAAECGELGISTGDIFAGRTPASIAVLTKGSVKETYADLPDNTEKAELTGSQMNVLLACGMGVPCRKYCIPVHFVFDFHTEQGKETESGTPGSSGKPAISGMTPSFVKEAVDRVLRVHPALYARITEENGRCYMVRTPFPEEGICTAAEKTEEEAVAFEKNYVNRIALGTDPLIQAEAFLCGSRLHIFLNMHHIVSDGTSVQILIRELKESLEGKLPEKETTDAFALKEAEERKLKGNALAESRTWFSNLLGGVETDSNLLADFKPEETACPPSRTLKEKLTVPGLTERLTAGSLTENTFFMGVFGYTLAKMTGQAESLFCTAENGREASCVDRTVNMMVRTLPVYQRIDEESAPEEMLTVLQNQFFNTMRSDCVSFGELAAEYGIRSDVMFVYQGELFSGAEDENGSVKVIMGDGGEAEANLSLMIMKEKDGYLLQLFYRSDLYKEETVRRFLKLFRAAAEHMAAGRPLKELVLISEEDCAFLDRENRILDTAADETSTVPDLFRRTAEKYPDRLLVSYKENRYTYRQAEELTDRLAWYLHGKGIGRGSVVSVLIPRNEFMVLASLGVLKSGAAYQPLDPSYPVERLSFMVKDAGAGLLIADRELRDLLSDFTGPVLYTDEILSLPETEKDEAGNLPLEASLPSDTYILLYTSGTTGTPKGVMLKHSNLVSYVKAYADLLPLEEGGIVANYASYGFDAHMADIYPAIYRGCSLVIIPSEIRLDLPAVKEFCEANKVTNLFMTTQVTRQFAEQFPHVEHLKTLGCGGEKLVSLTPPEYRLLNLYGPTECTCCVTGFHVDRCYDNIPIGHSMENSRIYVADGYGRRVPAGVPGELIICGPQVGKGYLNRPEQTEKAFVPNTYEKLTGEEAQKYAACYRTGDVVRFLSDGNIEFIGRRDMQVKIRGFRIELGEVERAVRECPGIADATVVALDTPGGKQLAAYVVSEERIDPEAIGKSIGKSHPAYMIPSAIMQIDRVPLNANGKVDRRKLPAPEVHFEDMTKPENELQQRICEKCVQAMGTEGFGIRADLFEAGLSSIGSIRLCSLLAEEFGINFQIRDLKKNETVEKLENFIRKKAGLVPAASAQDETNKGKPAENAQPGASQEKAGKAQQEVRSEYGPAVLITRTMEGIFVECAGRPDSTFYNIPYLLKLGKGIDKNRLKEAIVKAVKAHPGLKAELFTDEDGKVCQHERIRPDFTAADIAETEVPDMAELVSHPEKLVRPFQLTGSRLFRAELYTEKEDLYLFLDIHHIIADGTSLNILLEDVEKACRGETPEPEKYTGFDAAREEQDLRAGEDLAEAKAYWENLLEEADKDFLLLPDRYSFDPEAEGELKLFQMEADAAKVKAYCEQNRISANAFLVSCFGLTLARFAGMEYSVFNTIYNGRNDSRLARSTAMLVKTLPVVCPAAETVKELTGKVASQLMDSMANDLYSYGEISRALGVRNDVMFIFQGGAFERNSFLGVSAEEMPLALSGQKMPMSLQVMLTAGKLRYVFEYDPDRFTEKLALSFVRAFDRVVSLFTKVEKLREVNLLTPEMEEEMEIFNRTEKDYDRTETITGLFLKQAERQPEHLCIAYKNTRLSFGEAEMRSGKLAKHLMELGIGKGDVVSILIHRNENMMICAHGVLRSGAAYVGLDPTYPPERLSFMAEDSGSKLLLCEKELEGLIPDYQGPVLYTEDIEGLPEMMPAEAAAFAGDPKHQVTPENDALIIYSSGTTGKPKGSVLQHKAVVCFHHNYTENVKIDAGASVAHYASFGFDGGSMDIFSCAMAGAALFVIPDEIRMDLSGLEEFYCTNKITNGFMTTQVGCMFIGTTRCKTLRYFMTGGEKFVPVSGPGWVCLQNGYGPSETMCYVNHYNVRSMDKLQPIGAVSPNTKEYIIDRYGNRQPFGACGELCISGGQLGRGYLNRPEKTAEVFVANPFSAEPGYGRMYRTGDVVRMLTDGNYDFVGRRDGQVKIRGFRVEVSEVEQQIRKFAGVESAVVTAYDSPAGGKYLAAFITGEMELDQDALRDFIGKEKPDYMIPAVIMQVEAIPLTSNGKVDFRKLPRPEQKALRKGAEAADETEEKLCRIFGGVLGLEKVYADDDFFAIGGSSISAIQVVVKCEQAGFPVVYKNLFANPTPQKLAGFIRGGRAETVRAGDLEKEREFDYSALDHNRTDYLPYLRESGVGNVLLTGVTGFLGSHIYRELMDSTEGRVICLIRGREGQTAEDRLEMIMTYYFEDWLNADHRERTEIVEGALGDEDMPEKLAALSFDTIINCAADVRHFAVAEELIRANYDGAEKMIRIAEKRHARLIQISTVSVAGESVNGSVPAEKRLMENELNIGQSLENQYIYSKYLAEQAVIDAVSRGRIRGKIIRLGNLMARIGDSEFQVNAGSSGFLRQFRGFKKLGCFPVGMLDMPVEFSPIDCVAKAVVLLSGTQDEYTVFHAYNCNSIHMSYLLAAMQRAGMQIEIVENDVFEARLAKALEKEEDVDELGGLLAYRDRTGSPAGEEHKEKGETATRFKVAYDCGFTAKALYRLHFAWPLISETYLDRMVRVLGELNFF